MRVRLEVVDDDGREPFVRIIEEVRRRAEAEERERERLARLGRRTGGGHAGDEPVTWWGRTPSAYLNEPAPQPELSTSTTGGGSSGYEDEEEEEEEEDDDDEDDDEEAREDEVGDVAATNEDADEKVAQVELRPAVHARHDVVSRRRAETA